MYIWNKRIGQVRPNRDPSITFVWPAALHIQVAVFNIQGLKAWIASHLEPEDDGPNETQGESWTAINDVMSTHVLQMHSLFMQEGQGLVHILQAVNSHLAFGWSRLKQCKNKHTVPVPELKEMKDNTNTHYHMHSVSILIMTSDLFGAQIGSQRLFKQIHPVEFNCSAGIYVLVIVTTY